MYASVKDMHKVPELTKCMCKHNISHPICTDQACASHAYIFRIVNVDGHILVVCASCICFSTATATLAAAKKLSVLDSAII